MEVYVTDKTQLGKPLAELLRPTDLKDMVGNVEFSEANLHKLQSLILWGPPGSGKTTLARIIATKSGLPNVSLSAVSSGTTDFRQVFDIANRGTKMVLMIDEIHHLNKTQQDIFLPHLESGNIILVGTTTENPSFELRQALLSRCKVIVFPRLTNEDLLKIIARAEASLGRAPFLTDDAKLCLCEHADGDARYLLNRLEEIAHANVPHPIGPEELGNIVTQKLKRYDKNAEEHYNLISAFHKSIRGSDANAAIYWLVRMLRGGEDPLYIARRLVRAAVEDVGMADPQALTIAMSAVDAYHFLGSPEGELAIAEAVVYVATAPKSNAVYNAYNESCAYVDRTGALPPPEHAVNAPTKLMKELGYGKGYVYDHNTEHAFSGQSYFPGERQNFYRPNDRGFEREIKKRMDWWDSKRHGGRHDRETHS
ncbi:MAG: replication-associated recombination protein A [Holosporales bacterium]|jgi:putative ATPase|nr:replication-associated recombination protein A [Holosporales bacterium]